MRVSYVLFYVSHMIFIWALPPKGGRAFRLKQIPLKGDTRLQSLMRICSVLFFNHSVLLSLPRLQSSDFDMNRKIKNY